VRLSDRIDRSDRDSSRERKPLASAQKSVDDLMRGCPAQIARPYDPRWIETPDVDTLFDELPTDLIRLDLPLDVGALCLGRPVSLREESRGFVAPSENDDRARVDDRPHPLLYCCHQQVSSQASCACEDARRVVARRRVLGRDMEETIDTGEACRECLGRSKIYKVMFRATLDQIVDEPIFRAQQKINGEAPLTQFPRDVVSDVARCAGDDYTLHVDDGSLFDPPVERADISANTDGNQASAFPSRLRPLLLFRRNMAVSQASKQSEISELRLGIVCPMANEASTAVEFVNAVLDQVREQRFGSVDLFVVLDHVSKDPTKELLENLATLRPELHVIWAPENRGIADAYIRGYREALAAGSDWILELDAGFSHRPEHMPHFFEAMLGGADCVFGSRFCEGGRNEGTLRRRFISRGGTVLTNMLLGTKLSDMTSGFQLFTRPALEAILAKGIDSTGPFFQTEMKTHARDLRIVEVPIRYIGGSHTVGKHALRESLRNLARLFGRRVRGRL
jgi:dolichol-phosphate mannosyltransferase